MNIQINILMNKIAFVFVILTLAGSAHSETYDYFDPSVNAYSIVKKTLVGDEYLAIVHGFSDNRTTCYEIIEEYNKRLGLSIITGKYDCVPAKKRKL